MIISSLVPFRDSSLTKLLKHALGGNSKTIMVRFPLFQYYYDQLQFNIEIMCICIT